MNVLWKKKCQKLYRYVHETENASIYVQTNTLPVTCEHLRRYTKMTKLSPMSQLKQEITIYVHMYVSADACKYSY